MSKPLNAGDFNHRVIIKRITQEKDGAGFKTPTETEVCRAWASVNTTKGYTLIAQGTAFEDATTRLLIRRPNTVIEDSDIVVFKGKEWRIRYLNDDDPEKRVVELQIQVVTQKGVQQNG